MTGGGAEEVGQDKAHFSELGTLYYSIEHFLSQVADNFLIVQFMGFLVLLSNSFLQLSGLPREPTVLLLPPFSSFCLLWVFPKAHVYGFNPHFVLKGSKSTLLALFSH